MFQKIALFCTISLIVLIFMGGIVRASGSGMGCPDWPKCWGQYIPPTSKEQIDTSKLDLEKYKRKRARYGGNPEEITEENVIDEFNPVHTWTEYINRLLSMPIGIGSFVLLIYAQVHFFKKRKLLLVLSYTSVILVLVNAIMGAVVVYTGLSPGVITTHMALAILLLCILVFLVWNGGDERRHMIFSDKRKVIVSIAWILFVLICIEGVMGSQVREMTDELKKSHGDAPRSEWTAELENTWVYLIHRSFSWLILLFTLTYGWLNLKYAQSKLTWVEVVVILNVLSQMVLGLVLSNVGILPIAQVLHVGLSSILVATLFYWLLTATQDRLTPQAAMSGSDGRN